MLARVITRIKGFTPVVITRILKFIMMTMAAYSSDPLMRRFPIVPKESKISLSSVQTSTSKEATPKRTAKPTLRRKTV